MGDYKTYKAINRGNNPYVESFFVKGELAGANCTIKTNSPFQAHCADFLATLSSVILCLAGCGLTYLVNPNLIEGWAASLTAPYILRPLWRWSWLQGLKSEKRLKIDRHGLHIPKLPFGYRTFPHTCGLDVSIKPHGGIKEEELKLSQHRFEQQANKPDHRSFKKAYKALSVELSIEAAGNCIWYREIYDPKGRIAPAIAQRLTFLINFFNPHHPTNLSASSHWSKGSGDL